MVEEASKDVWGDGAAIIVLISVLCDRITGYGNRHIERELDEDRGTVL